jgi:hypothetical protein
MPRAKKLSASREEETKPVLRAAKPKGKQWNKYCVYAHTQLGVEDPRLIALTFATAAEAKAFIDRILRNKEYKWEKNQYGHEVIKAEGHITIRMWNPQLTEVMECEEDAELSEHAMQQARFIRTGRSQQVALAHVDTRKPKGERVARVGSDKPAREKKEKKPKVDKTGLVTISQIAEELKVIPREARGVLRSNAVPKPDAGWAWPPAEADAIRKMVKKALTK